MNKILRPTVLILSIVLSAIIVGAAYVNGYDNIQGKPDGLSKIILILLLINVTGSIVRIVAETLRILDCWKKTTEERVREE